MKKKYILLFASASVYLAAILGAVHSNAQTISTFAGTGINGFSGDGGTATAAKLGLPLDITVDASGNFYITDKSNQRIRKIDPTGTISTICGDGTLSYYGDNGPATNAALHFPSHLVVDGSGNIIFSDSWNDVLRKIDVSGIITTIAGNGLPGYMGDGGAATAAKLKSPTGLAIDGSGNIFIAQPDDDVVRKISTTGIITTVAGNGTAGFSGDGGAATAAQLDVPNDVAVDASGNLYIADMSNNRIRMVSTTGNISTFAGTGIAAFGGDGGPATGASFTFPITVSIDASGNLYVADGANYRIRKINTSGIINTVAGNGISGISGDGGPATAAELGGINGMVTDATGNLYIVDNANNRVRKVAAMVTTAVADPVNMQHTANELAIYPNPANGILNIAMPEGASSLMITDMIGRTLLTKNIANGIAHQLTLNVSELPAGNYILKTIGTDKTYINKVIIH